MGVPLVKDGQNLPPMVGIGLNDLPNIGEPLAPLAPPVPASLRHMPKYVHMAGDTLDHLK